MPADLSVERRPWPFRAAPTHHDSQVSPEGASVPPRQEVEFKDGRRIWLRRVMVAGAPHLYLRELGEPAAGARIDLRQLIPDVERTLPGSGARAVATYVARELRGGYADLEAFLDIAAPGWRQST